MITILSKDRQLTVYPNGKLGPFFIQTINSTLGKDPFVHSISRDLISIGQAIYTADRAVRRYSYLGRQTRDIRVEIDLENPAIFTHARKELVSFAEFCTRDNWNFTFGSLKSSSSKKPIFDRNPEKFDCVALFSDGLDSLCGAVHLIELSSKPFFVSHYQPRWGFSSSLKRLSEITESYKTMEHNYASITIRFQLSDKDRKGRHNSFPEYTLRSRPCLYLCYAAAVAVEYNIERILLHENGILALNLPYSRSHFGSLISRHAHPVTLHKFQTFLSKIWPREGCSPKVENPFFLYTKADQVSMFCKLLPEKLIESTISCENASRTLLTYKGKLKKQNGYNQIDFTHCGVCTPCLIRRQAMSAAGYLERNNYAFGWKGPETSKQALLQTFMNDNFQIVENHCKELLKQTERDFLHRYCAELSLLSECFTDLTSKITEIYKLQIRFANQYLETIGKL